MKEEQLMEEHETVREMTLGQLKDIVITLGSAAPDNLTFEQAKYLSGNKGLLIGTVQEAIQTLLQKAFSVVQEPIFDKSTTYPADGEIFELTLDGAAAENDPIEMVRRDGYDPESWKYTGEKVIGKQTSRFKLVWVGYCRNLNEVREKLAAHGSIPEGQWREAFKTAYPQPDGKGPVGFADPSWVDPDGSARFPCVDGDGGSDFRWTGDDFDGDWRWVVAVGK